MNTPLVSIIIPAYNATEYIEAMLDCIIGQTYKNIEVINDGSTDDTLDKIQKYASLDSRIVVLDVPNGGVSHARNLGIKRAKEENLLFFFDSDDIVDAYAVEHCINYMASNPMRSSLGLIIKWMARKQNQGVPWRGFTEAKIL